MSIKVIDNFLSEDDFNFLYSGIALDPLFPWFFHHVIDDEDKIEHPLYNFQFVHIFYLDASPRGQHIGLTVPLIKKINPSSLIRIKANLNTKTEENIFHGFHCDVPFPESKTAVYYLNTNDGYTLFEDGTKVYSVANRFVEFDSTIMHTGCTPTNESRRLVINLNYFPSEDSDII